MEISHLAIYALAVWRVASLFVNERGPFDMFVHVRKLAGILHDEDKIPFMIPSHFFAQVLSCVWCASIWLSFFLTVFWLFSPEWSLKFSTPFAISGGAILIDSLINRKT